ncbi:MAG: CCA tRNA nucleotidyltransferase [Ruminococcaceae bacterium]|nr:CCA tRNA nucleotidyltransferase [Oscillospiraceae bacterium]
MNFHLPKKIEYVLDTLISNGHKAYIVGGCVRDLLCGKEPHDYDITTSATPNETQSLFKKTIATGIKHGTITVIIDGEQIEVTTFRTESSYNDNRHPESVSFVRDVSEDLARRDFTVNAMCYNNCEGVIDLFGGQSDIKNKTLKAVGDAKTRFCEDALRILRLFRFASTLEFKIEKNTFDAAIECAPLLKNISAERIFTELTKTACGNNISVISPLLDTNALLDFSLESTDLTVLQKLQNKEDLRVFALLYLTSTNLQNTLNALKCSNTFKDYCTKLSHLIKNGIKADKTGIKKALCTTNYDIVCDYFEYLKSILKLDTTGHKSLLKEIINSNEPYKISHLDITGNDIMSLGFNGKQVGEKLEFLLNEVIKNPALNTREKLLNLICN